jgi:hypothetical protein
MSLQRIKTAVDHQQPQLGDVVIVKRTVCDVSAPAGKQLQTICTKCGSKFPTQFRRMSRKGEGRDCEVRNIPQCSACRSKKKAVVVVNPLRPQFKAGDIVRCIEGGNFGSRPLVVGRLYTVTEFEARDLPRSSNPFSGQTEDRVSLAQYTDVWERLATCACRFEMATPRVGEMVTCDLLTVPHAFVPEGCKNAKLVAPEVSP